MDDIALENIYREELDEKLIAYLAKVKGLSLEKAMDIYYQSRLAELIEKGECGIQYLDYKVLVEMLLDTEPQWFEKDLET